MYSNISLMVISTNGNLYNNASVDTENLNENELLMTGSLYIVTGVVLTLIGFFGFFFNLFVILLMCKDQQLWTPLNIILFNLVCSDFSVSVFGNPFTMISAFNKGWFFGRSMCIIYGFFMSLFGITSITTLTVLSFERFVMVSRPFAHRLGHGNAKIAVILIWIYSLLLTLPPLCGWGAYVSEAANISCSVNWESQSLNASTYIAFLFIFGLVIPMIVITYSYTNIVLTMKQNELRAGRVSKAERRVTVMVFVMIVAFMVAWTPYSVFALITQFWDPYFFSPGAAVIPALVAKSSICYNPIIYVGLNTQFTQSWKDLMGWTVETPRDDLNNTICINNQCISNATLDSVAVETKRFLITLINKETISPDSTPVTPVKSHDKSFKREYISLKVVNTSSVQRTDD